MNKDTLTITGTLTVHRVPKDAKAPLSRAELEQAVKDGTATLTLCQHNLVVNQGLQVLSRYLGNLVGSPFIGGISISSLQDLTVKWMDLGTQANPPAPDPIDTVGSYGSLLSRDPVVTYPDEFTAEFSMLVPAASAAGVTFTNESITLMNGLLFARTVFSVTGSSEFALQFSHSFSLTLPNSLTPPVPPANPYNALMIGTSIGVFALRSGVWYRVVALPVAHSLVQQDPVSGDIFVGTPGHVFRSTDLGKTWVDHVVSGSAAGEALSVFSRGDGQYCAITGSDLVSSSSFLATATAAHYSTDLTNWVNFVDDPDAGLSATGNATEMVWDGSDIIVASDSYFYRLNRSDRTISKFQLSSPADAAYNIVRSASHFFTIHGFTELDTPKVCRSTTLDASTVASDDTLDFAVPFPGSYWLRNPGHGKIFAIRSGDNSDQTYISESFKISWLPSAPMSDGVTWTPSVVNPILSHGNIGQQTLIPLWDAAAEKYIAYISNDGGGYILYFLDSADGSVWSNGIQLITPGARMSTRSGYSYANIPVQPVPLPDPGVWVSVVSPSVPMGWQICNRAVDVSISGDRVLHLGGAEISGGVQSSGYTYDAYSNSWVWGPNLIDSVADSCVAVLPSGNVLLMGGIRDIGSVTNQCWLLNVSTMTWSSAPPMAQARRYHSAITAPGLTLGDVMVMGGVDNDGVYLDTVEIFDEGTMAWTAGNPMASARASFACAVVGTHVMVAGGSIGTAYLSGVELYSLASNTWSSGPAIPGSAELADATIVVLSPTTAALIGGAVYAGYAAGGVYPVTDVGGLSGCVWGSPVMMVQPRSGHRSALMRNGGVMIAGGSNGGTPVTDSEVYDTIAGQCLVDASMVDDHDRSSLLVLSNGALYCPGRYTTSPMLYNPTPIIPVPPPPMT